MKKIILILVLFIFISSCAEEVEKKAVEQPIEEAEGEPIVKPEAKETAEEEMVRGIVDPNLEVHPYDSHRAWTGTTLFADNHDENQPRIIEVNMLGEIIWEYLLPEELKEYRNPGSDVEWLSNDNILFVAPRKGVYEIDRKGNIVWSYLDEEISHDADRLSNGNTIFVCGGHDEMSDAQVKEVNPKGKIVWEWYAKDYFDKEPYKSIEEQGWTHTNAVTRLRNGNTLISPRNFHHLVEVDPQGEVVRIIGKGFFEHQHDPEVLSNGNILTAVHTKPGKVIEFNPETKEIVWEYTEKRRRNSPIRDADRLPNGNTLITGLIKIFEVTPEGKVVWQLSYKGTENWERKDLKEKGFYKAERVSKQKK